MSESKEQTTDEYRRNFFKTTLAAAGAAAGMGLIPGVSVISVGHAKSNNEPASSKQRWGMLIDANKCSDGCTECIKACNDEFQIKPSKKASQTVQFIRKVKLKHNVSKRVVSIPLMCQHCENPPCVDVCPTGASMKRADGICRVDMHRCIGCRFCMMACPYKARSFIHEPVTDQVAHAPRGQGCVDSCNLCAHRIDKDRDNPTAPACVEACNKKGHKAMYFGDLNDEKSEISQQLNKYQSRELRADLGLNTGVRYRGI
jgi:molybdopterin-containing oxidoreductase family iron-sulfur binding subunit